MRFSEAVITCVTPPSVVNALDTTKRSFSKTCRKLGLGISIVAERLGLSVIRPIDQRKLDRWRRFETSGDRGEGEGRAIHPLRTSDAGES